MPKPARNRNMASAEQKLKRVLSAFGKLTPKERRQFANAFFSDGGPTNPKLNNPSKASRGAMQVPATSDFGQPSPDDMDYFRQARDFPGNYATDPDVSMTPGRVTLSVRMRNNPIRGLDFERFVKYLDDWRLGFFRNAGMTWEMMERRDYQLQVVRPKRMKSVARHGYDILIRDDVPDGQKDLAQQQKDFLSQFYGNCSATTAINPDEEGGFSLLVRQMMDAVGKFYAVHEIIWQPLADGTLTAKFIFCPIYWFEGTRGKLRFLPSEFQVYGIDMQPGDWLVTCGDGIMEACSIVYLMKALVLKSNLAFLDKFGQPGIHGETDAAKGTADWDNFVEAISDFGEEWATVTNRGAKINLIETKANGDAGYQKIIDLFDRSITQLWRGGDLGTKSSQHGAGASLQEDESEILETDDCKMIEETLELKVSKYALAWKFGQDAPVLAYIKLRTTPRRDIQDDLAVDEFLSTFKDKNGKTLLGVQTTLERYSRPLPKPDEDTLEPGTPPAPAGAKGPDGKPLIPPAKDDANPEFQNAADDASREVYIEAVLAEFRSINQRLEAISQIDDADLLKQKLAGILADLDALQKNLNHDPAIAQAIYKILSANVANGIAATKDLPQ